MIKNLVLQNLKQVQGHKKLRWLDNIANVILLGLFFTSAVVPNVAQADVIKGQQNIRYDVYAGGIHALQSDLNIDLSNEKAYSLNLKAKTYGLLGKMAPWEGEFFSKGWALGNFYNPEQHLSSSTWRNEVETKEYRYNQDGNFISYQVSKNKKAAVKKEVSDKLTDKTSDMLTATLNIMKQIAENGKCEGSTDVFDGKRRFKLVFKEKATVDMTASRWNVYEGVAVECTAEVQPIAGKWHEKPRGWMSIQEQGRERGTMPTVWFAKISKDQPAVPVKVRVKTSYGTLFMHMTKYETAGKILSLK